MQNLELYLHVPFCVKKCAYCDFLSAPGTPAQQKAYLRALEREILQFPCKDRYCVSTVFFGGGTPSILPAEWTAELMGLLRREFRTDEDAEVTIECNPGTADAEKLRIYRSSGINRLSLGLQSADDRELAVLGRIHTWQDFLRTYCAAAEAGFENISVDLMSALPGQTVRSWEHTLTEVLKLRPRPRHISAYSLIIEEGTPFYERYREDDELRARGGCPRILPSEEEEREMYRLTEEMLSAAGMRRYEISNYALPGYECRHNIGYWTGAQYAGFGLGASSFLKAGISAGLPAGGCSGRGAAHRMREDTSAGHPAGGPGPEMDARPQRPAAVRVHNPENLREYVAGVFSGREFTVLSENDQIEEFMFLGLRMIQGVSEAEFHEKFGKTVDELYGEVLRKHCTDGLLVRKEGRIALTARGLDLSNVVMADFLL